MGSINLDNTGSGSGITLSSDGTSLLLDGTAIGGGGADLYAANESSPAAQPSATGANAIAIGDSAVASDEDAFAGPLSRAAGTHSVALGIANNSSSYGAGGSYAVSLGYQSRAMALQSVALGAGAYVDSDSSRGLALGENAYVQQCDYGSAIGAAARVHGGNSATEAIAIGSSYASGTSSFAAAIANNSSSYGATGANSIAIGKLAKASNTSTIAIGADALASGYQAQAIGNQTDATATNSSAFGNGSQATASNATAIGGATASASYSTAIGKTSINNGAVATSGNAAMALNGYASGAASFAAAIDNNTSSYGATSGNSIAIGFRAKSTDTGSVSIGSYSQAIATYAHSFGQGAKAWGVRSLALGYNAKANAADAVSIGKDADVASGATGGFAAGFQADVNNQYAIAGPKARGWGDYGVAFGFEAQSQANHAVSIGSSSGANGARNTGAGAVVLGGSHASGTDSFAAAIANNSSSYGASGSNSIAMGRQAKATGSNAIALGWLSQSTAAGSVVIGSGAGQATATGAVSIGGYTLAGAKATGAESMALGNSSVAAEQGKLARACGHFGAAGDAQGGQFILRADTTDATATVLTANNYTVSSTNQIVAASDTCITFDGTITAMQNGAQAYASWKIEGLLVNDGGTTTLANSATTVIQNLSGWGMALSADNTNNALAITCTGEASHNIRWVANIRTTEVTYA